MTGAFDRVYPTRLLNILRKKRMPGWLVRWTCTFLSSRTTTLVIQNKETEPFPIEYGVPQGSPLSPTLFALYVSELLEICNQRKKRLSAIGFADDTHILTYGTSTTINCRTLEQAHERYLAWAARHAMCFAPNKYELTHFTCSRKRFDLQAGAKFGSISKAPSPDVRVLGVWLNTKLRWTAHARELRAKAAKQYRALTRTTASTWGASFVRARKVYSLVLRPLLAYGAAVWHTPTPENTGKIKGLATKLCNVQNKCLLSSSHSNS
jgi:hypothetical protein